MNRPSLTQGFLAGVAAGLAASLVALVVRAVAGIPTPAESMADPATLVMPAGDVRAHALSLLEFSRQAGARRSAFLTVQLLLAGVVGATYALVTRNVRGIVGTLRNAVILTLANSVGAWIVFLPLADKGIFGSEDPAGAPSHIAGALLANGVYSLVLVLNLRSMAHEADAGDREGWIASPSRRRLLAQVGLGAVAILVGGGALAAKVPPELWKQRPGAD